MDWRWSAAYAADPAEFEQDARFVEVPDGGRFEDKSQQNLWTERGRATSVSNSNATGRPLRSVPAFGNAMRARRIIVRSSPFAFASVACWLLWGFLFTPEIDLRHHKPIGDQIWKAIVASGRSSGEYPQSEEELLRSDILPEVERRMFLGRHFGHRKFHYIVDHRFGPTLTLDQVPGTLYAVTVWHTKTNAEPSGAANRSQPFRAETNRPSGSAVSRR